MSAESDKSLPKIQKIMVSSSKNRPRYMEVLEILLRKKFHPIYALIEMASDQELDASIRLKATIALANKSYPDLRSIEHSGDKEAPVLINFNIPEALKK